MISVKTAQMRSVANVKHFICLPISFCSH